jgi:hypothetical protein
MTPKPSWQAQLAQQKILPPASTPWPMTLHPQCLQTGANASMAHSKQSKLCDLPPHVTWNVLS